MTQVRVLMVLTSNDVLGVSGLKTGSWFDEVATPYYKFKQAGFSVTFATPRGGEAPIDPLSAEDKWMTESTRRFAGDASAKRAVADTLKFGEIDTSEFDGVFFPGALGQLWDLANDSRVIHSIEKWVAENTPVAMVCHAPSILRDAKKQNGDPLVRGMNITGFTEAEDEELGTARHLPFSLERALVQNGANFTRANQNFGVNIVDDGPLLTGQNPASAGPLADALIARLRPRRHATAQR